MNSDLKTVLLIIGAILPIVLGVIVFIILNKLEIDFIKDFILVVIILVFFIGVLSGYYLRE